MKNISKAILAGFVLSAAFLVSCDKEISTSPLTLDKSKATIKGYVYANTDLTKLGYETAPAGTKVVITMDYDQISGLGSSNGTLIDTVKLAADGTFQYQVPSDANGVTVYVNIKFVYAQVQPLGEQNATRLKTFSGSTSYFVKTGETLAQRIDLDEDNTLDEVYDWVTISGTVYCDYDLSVGGYEKLPSGTKLIFRTDYTNSNGWSQEVTVSTDGKFTVKVPSNISIYIDYNFTLPGKLSGGGNVTYRFQDSNQYVDNTSVDVKDEAIYLTAGVSE
jgi:hypothetical protein